MGLISKLADKKEKQGKLNTGQYGFKPWMANLIMGIFELILVVGWFLIGFVAMFAAIFSGVLTFDLDIIDGADIAVTLLLIVLYLVWNLLVWLIKPLRTHFNYCESMWNLLFIAWLLVDVVTTAIS